MSLESSIETLRGVGPKTAQVLSKKGLSTIEDVLYFIPRTYQDRTKITPIGKLQPGRDATILGKLGAVSEIGFGRAKRLHAKVDDGTGKLTLVWFHAHPSLQQQLEPGATILAYGTVTLFGAILQISHPEFETVENLVQGKPPASLNFGRIIPVYSESEGLHQKMLRKLTAQALEQNLEHLEESLPDSLRQRLKLPTLRESLLHLHYPPKMPIEGQMGSELTRLAFEEFFVLQLGLLIKKQTRQQQPAYQILPNSAYSAEYRKQLPFSLTEDQNMALHDIFSDMRSNKAMRRLIQGDVGCGKTVVALAALGAVAQSGLQGVLMAPTEVLAIQHFATAQRILEPLGIKTIFIAHSTKEKKEAFRKILSGEVQVVVGTHAVFQSAVEFQKLGLVVVDEQHRFGVEQRSELLKKGKELSPHLLMMTATPIPRTLALTLYGDLDITWITHKPQNRAPIKTRIIRDRERVKVYDLIRKTVTAGQQAYLIYPLVENSEKLDLKSATEMFEKIRQIFPDFKVGLLHGRMKSDEKESILNSFKKGEIDLLVSTTVIEVGIDVANATLIVIEHPERLGLSQLHQLRGRVGRGDLPSQCVLLAEDFVTERLRILEQTEDGFKIAEEDLRIRGPGEFLGTKQSGLPGFRIGHIVRDAALLRIAKEEAEKLLTEDPKLSASKNARIREMVETRWSQKIQRLGDG